MRFLRVKEMAEPQELKVMSIIRRCTLEKAFPSSKIGGGE